MALPSETQFTGLMLKSIFRFECMPGPSDSKFSGTGLGAGSGLGAQGWERVLALGLHSGSFVGCLMLCFGPYCSEQTTV